MDNDLKFTISIVKNGCLKEEYRPKYKILGYREVKSKLDESYEEPIYGECIGTEVVNVSYDAIVNEYEQIPLIIDDIPFSVVQTYEFDKKRRSMELCKEISEMGKFCPIERLEKIVSEYNKYISGYRHGNYSISYGYQYTKYDIVSGREKSKKIRRNFTNQEDRNQAALYETGYNFEQLDWSDKIGPTEIALNILKQKTK